MGWIGQLIETFKGAEAVDFVLTPPLGIERDDGTRSPPTPEKLQPDACYIELFVEAMWLPKARKLSSFYHGVVHANTALERLGEGKAQFALVSTPTELAKVDPKSLRRVVTRSIRALGPVPWRGGDLDLEMGLFSVNSGDLADSVLDIVTSMAGTAGVSFVASAAPFIPFVRKGMQLVTGASGDNVLEVGLEKTLSDPETGFYALIAADRPNLDTSNLAVAFSDHRLLSNGQTLTTHPWLVFRIGSVREKADFASIPDVKSAWGTFQAAVRSRKRSDAEEALANLRFTTLTSPDLVGDDAERLIVRASDIMTRCFSGVAQNLRLETSAEIPELENIGLYDTSGSARVEDEG